jgi:hypothetical protein
MLIGKRLLYPRTKKSKSGNWEEIWQVRAILAAAMQYLWLAASAAAFSDTKIVGLALYTAF